MNSVVKKEIILVPGSKVTVEEMDGKSVLTIYEAMKEPELVIAWDKDGCNRACLAEKSTFGGNWDYIIPFESIEQYKSILRGEYQPK